MNNVLVWRITELQSRRCNSKTSLRKPERSQRRLWDLQISPLWDVSETLYETSQRCIWDASMPARIELCNFTIIGLRHEYFPGYLRLSNSEHLLLYSLLINYYFPQILRFLLFFPDIIPARIDASQMHLWDASCSVFETSQRGLIFKSLRRLRWDVLKTLSQRRHWNLSGLLRDIFALHLRLYFFAFKLRHFLPTCWSTYVSLNILPI